MKISLKTVIGLAVLSVLPPLYASGNNTSAVNGQANSEAKALFENHCLSCHQPHKKGKHSVNKPVGNKQNHRNGSHPKRLAPPMAMVKKHYLQTYPDREQFITKVSTWVKAPDANTAMLHHAVEKFGVMPPQMIDESSRRQIAAYIYDVLPAGHSKKKDGDKPCKRD